MNKMEELALAVKAKNTAVLLGLDPRSFDICEGQSRVSYAKELMNALKNEIVAVKPNLAFYGDPNAYSDKEIREICKFAKSLGLFTIADVKLGDIGTTAQKYAESFLINTPYDFITVNGLAGEECIMPFAEIAAKNNKGIFVLVHMSNKSSSRLQDFKNQQGKPWYLEMADVVKECGEKSGTKSTNDQYNNVGAVVGATYPQQAAELRAYMPNTFFLVPGYGAQGGTAESVQPNFDKNGTGAIINNSRGLYYTVDGDGIGLKERLAASLNAAQNMKNQINIVRGK